MMIRVTGDEIQKVSSSLRLNHVLAIKYQFEGVICLVSTHFELHRVSVEEVPAVTSHSHLPMTCDGRDGEYNSLFSF